VAHRKLAILRRRTFTALSVLSLLLSAATVTLWVRSHWQRDTIFHRSVDSNLALHVQTAVSQRGLLIVAASTHSFPRDRPPLGWWRYASQVSDVDLYLDQFDSSAGGSGLVLGFGFRSIVESGITYGATALPHWFLALLFAILPVLHLRAAIRSRRLNRAGHCPRCGYDLRATPQRCPECGRANSATEITEITEETNSSLATDEHR